MAQATFQRRRPRRLGIKLALPLLLAAAAACAEPQMFRPAESATATSPEGYSAAMYPVIIAGDAVGKTKVWSAGAYREKDASGAHTVLHVGFELNNNGSQPIWLDTDSLQLDSATTNGRVLPPVRPTRITGSLEAAAESDAESHVYFILPEGVKPQDVDSFRVHWVVRDAAGKYAQRTPFLEQKPIPAYEPVPFYHSPFYDPFLYPGPFTNELVVVEPRVYHHPR